MIAVSQSFQRLTCEIHSGGDEAISVMYESTNTPAALMLRLIVIAVIEAEQQEYEAVSR